MAILGCTNTAASNYNPAATEDDGTCVYLVSMGGKCLQFEDTDAQERIEDRSFTLSFDTVDRKWAFFHDYFPDYYMHTRKGLLNLKNSKVFINNKGPRGLYHDRVKTKPFIIDVLFAGGESKILNSVKWVSEVRDGDNKEYDERSAALYNETISAITIWNNYQCTERILLSERNVALLGQNNRNSEQLWSFNDFRNVARENVQFLDTIFKNYKIKGTEINRNFPWYEQRLMEGKYFIVRFEFINNSDKQITLHDVDIDVDQSFR